MPYDWRAVSAVDMERAKAEGGREVEVEGPKEGGRAEVEDMRCRQALAGCSNTSCMRPKGDGGKGKCK